MQQALLSAKSFCLYAELYSALLSLITRCNYLHDNFVSFLNIDEVMDHMDDLYSKIGFVSVSHKNLFRVCRILELQNIGAIPIFKNVFRSLLRANNLWILNDTA